MTTIYLENGGQIGVYGDIKVEKGETGWSVILGGPIARVNPPGIMQSLSRTTAASLHEDDLPGHVFCCDPVDHTISQKEQVLIPPRRQTQWVLFEEDAELCTSPKGGDCSGTGTRVYS